MEYFDKEFCLDVKGEMACFTRPEFKVERVSYDVITPSAVRAIFEAIFWKPAIRWEVNRIDVLAPIRWTSVRRNEVGALASPRSKCIFIEDNRQQRNSLVLRDVHYRIYAKQIFIPTSQRKEDHNGGEDENPAKYNSMFERRARKGQCFNQPYLGTREFSASFRLVEKDETILYPPIQETRDLGLMHYDMDFNSKDLPPLYFRAQMEQGIINVPSINSEDILR